MRLPDHPAWTWTDTPMGEMLLVTTPVGVVTTAFCDPNGGGLPDEAEVLGSVRTPSGEALREDPTGLAWVTRQVHEWFDGQRRGFDVVVDLEAANPGGAQSFTRAVYEVIGEIPFGETASYGEVAAMAGSPRAARAVGTVCRDVPVALFLPVHRVIRADGTTGESPNSACHRRSLLQHERAVLGLGPSPWN